MINYKEIGIANIFEYASFSTAKNNYSFNSFFFAKNQRMSLCVDKMLKYSYGCNE